MSRNSRSLAEKMDSIREKIGDQGEMAANAMASEGSKGDADKADQTVIFFQDELYDLLTIIEQTKADLADIQPKHLSMNKIPEASSQLDQVVAATEEAASKIMDSAEEIADVAAALDGRLADQLMTISTNIFEASSFQDITGQRVTKVVNTLKYLEEKLSGLAEAIGDTDSHIKAAQDRENISPESDENLLQGPQNKASANNQDAIDALFDSFD